MICLSVFPIGASLLDALVLSVVSRDDTYGYKITHEIKEHFDVSESTLYPVLRRLQKNGSLSVYDSPYQGRNRRYYKITDSGCGKLEEYRADWLDYKKKVDMFLGEQDGDNDNGGDKL